MPLVIRELDGRRDRDRFIEVPFVLRAGDAQWVPPLRFERRAFLNPKKNPWFDHAKAQLFLAERDGRAVGRISAHIDYRWDEYQGGSDGFFGFFDSEEDGETAKALVETAVAWVRDQGRERILGPMDFTTNDECGLLIEGYDEPSMILEPWHPPYYRRLLEAQGMSKTIDLQMWELYFGDLKEGEQFTPMIHAAAKHSREQGVTVRPMRKRDMEAEITRFMEVYNVAWGRNWGFVPITEEEVRFQAKNLKPVLDENWAMIAEKDGAVVGAALTLPDVEQALAKMNGRLFPTGWWHFVRRKRYIDRLRVFALGVLPEHQHLGVAAALYERHLESAQDPGPSGGHMGWILETNKPMNRAMEGMGGRVVQRYRIYERACAADPFTLRRH
ncbi:MAG: GNAT family N-acetyltransferase [Actinomycetota bacterium]|nr:GNAT family N-acetyltransferase [Actinomycetota bacterium]